MITLFGNLHPKPHWHQYGKWTDWFVGSSFQERSCIICGKKTNRHMK